MDCLPADNEIVCENRQPGNPPSQWDVSGAGDAGIQGYATDISVDQGQTVNFKVDTASTDYRLEIYRLGYYGGDGARLIETIQPLAPPDVQPACLNDAPTGLVDCGNWDQSASWAVPAGAVSGVYIAHLVREDGPAEESHIVFIVRDDDGNSDLLVQTDDTTWQAYNQYGGNSLYVGSPAGRAYKVSYNRPFTTRGPTPEDWVFNATSPLIRFIERNGYDVSYFTGVDSHRLGAEISEHDAFISVGHDEYWSAGQRNNVTAARDAGTNLAFFSGNEIFWKTRWENSIDGADTPYRTLVSYKETRAGAKIDPAPEWTGTWRDDRSFNPEGPNPENGLTGTSFRVNSGTSEIEVPEADGNMRLWRNTAPADLAPGETEDLAADTLGYEWDEAPDNSSRPPGLVYNSSTTRNGVEVLQDNGSTYGSGTATHHLTQYRDANGAGAEDDALVFGAGTIQWVWGLDGIHDRGGSTPDPDMQQATANLFADMGAQPQTLQSGLVAATASTDTTAPNSVIESPLPGADVQSGAPFAISGSAIDAGGGVVGAVEVSTDGGTTWHPAVGRENWTYSWTPGATGSATIRTRATDDSGNIEAAGAGVSVDIVPRSCPCSIWSDSFTAPGDGDASAVELGVRFRSDDDGFITGIRFYKTAGNTGTHVGSLWANTGGSPLATATFTGETASGWQEVTFGAPVAIDADTTYVASYHAPNGNYAAVNSYFASGPFDSPPLHALGDGFDGANGVYRYGTGGVFPTDTFASSNYLVDVVFENDVGPDTAPPTITGRTPADGAGGVPTGTDVTATFNEPMDAGTIDGTTVELRDPGNALVAATVTYNPGNRRVTLDPSANLESSTTYTAKVKGGPGGVEDDADPGNPMAADSTWTFTTAAPPPPPPDEGPGGPILVISDASNPFSRYYAEILRSEGLNEFTVTDRSLVTPAILNQHDVVVLGETGLSAAQVTMLETWVDAGGNLIAMRPDPQLAGLLGLTDTPGTLADAYLQVNNGTPAGAGIVGQTMQFHSTADRYIPNGAETVATLYSDATTSTSNPAVTLRSVGGSGGQAAAFTYDLARSVVYTRQGNPAWSGDERDSAAGGGALIRSDDLFYGAKPGDVQPDWVDLNKVAIPQADEQQHLLTNLIQQMNVDRKPLPQFWFLPRDEKAAVVMTGDDHANGGTEARFNAYQGINPGCSVADWECVRGTSYIYPNTTSLSDAEADAFEGAGFEIALHVSTNCANWADRPQLEGFYANQLATFAASYPSLDAPTTNRTHCIAWSDWATQPKVELENDIRLDTNYYYFPPDWIQDRPGMFTGSGMPQRFADLDGSMIDVYQAATQMTDESGQSFPFTIDALLDNALGPQGYYGVFTANMHTDSPTSSGSDAIVASALARDVPVVSARQMLTWLDGRNGSSFGSITWNANKLNFNISVGAGANGLRAMVPTTSAVGDLTGVKLGSTPIPTTTRTIKGVSYAFFDAAAGAYEATYDVDDTPPSITNVAHSPLANGTADVTWDTNEASDSRVDYGTNPADLNQNQSSSGLVTSHGLQLTGLAPNTTYHYRVTSADAAANSTTDPEPPAAPRSFTTPSASFADTTVSDFSAGTSGPDTYIAETGDGDVILKPTEGQEFSGGPGGLPAGWTGCAWPACSGAPGPATVSGGSLHVNGGMANTNATYGPGRAVEFRATFGAASFQHLAFTDNFNSVWAMFSTRNGTNQVYASTNAANGLDDVAIPGSSSWIGTSHLYRIEWDSTEVRYFVDGFAVHTRPVTAFGSDLNLAASDFGTGGPELAVDWVRMSPYPAAGTFDSRIFDAGVGQSADWGALTWSSALPAGTSLAMSVRTGDTPTPDGSWSAFAPIASSGGDIPGSSRYVQYRAEPATTDAARTPTLSEVSIAFATGPDLTPPTIASRTPAPGATGVPGGTNVAVQFSEPMNPATITGSTVRLRKQGAGGDVAADVSYSGNTATLNPIADLDSESVYDVTVAGSVADTSDNALGADDSWSFTTASPAVSFTDTLVSDFAAGTPDANSYLAQTSDGEVILKPAEGSEFSNGPGIPAGWSSNDWSAFGGGAGGAATVSGGSLRLNGAFAGTTAAYGPGRALDAVATFGAAQFQHVGFGVDFNDSPNFAMFSTHTTTNEIRTRTNFGSGESTFIIPGSAALIGSPHRYRVEWIDSDPLDQVNFYVDGALVRTENGNFAADMRPAASDFKSPAQGSPDAGPELSVDWIRMSPYPSSPASATFDSRVFDSIQSADWGALTWDSATPAGTGIAMSVRTGNTPTPDLSWTAFTPIAASGGDIPGSTRYVQYRAVLTTTDPNQTPALNEVAVNGAVEPDVTAPTITGRSPAPNAVGVPRSTNVQAQFSEPMDGGTIDESTLRLRPQGGGGDIGASVTYSGVTATLDPNATLAPDTTYEVTVDGDVEDSNGNPVGADDTWLFTTAGATSASLTDTLVTGEFGDGITGADTYVSETADGEVTLNPTVGAEFSGTSLPAGWSERVPPWTGGGAATVSGGNLHVNGTYAGTDATFGPGHALEFVATFGAESFQHVGFSDNFENIFAIFSTNASTSQLQARASFTGNIDVGSPGQYVGSSHLYRIEWLAGEVRFYIDGALVAAPSGSFGPPGAMRPLASDFTNASPELTVDWMRMSPYPAAGTFDSRILDAGSSVDWDGLSWSEDTPAGTDIALSVRTGDSATPDGTWSAFTPIANSGGAIPGSSRYLQYRAELTTGNSDLTPALSEVTISYAESLPAPAAPTVTGTDPTGPADDNNPEVKGTVGSGDPTQVKIWRNATCTGPPDATGTVAQFIGAGITVNVADDTTTALSAKASNAAADSACSNTIDYVEDSAAPDAPTIDASTPASPANDNEPELAGSAEAGSTIRIYRAPTAADCTAANLAATGSEADFAAAGLTVSVGDDTTTSFRATATDAGNTSPCSAPFTYTEDSTAPETTIDSGPSGETNDSTPSFSFSSSEPGSSFECRFDADAFGPCSGPGDAHTAPAALTEGAHSFEVRATDQAANTDQSPALRAFTVDSLAPDAPSIDASTPASPANDNEPELAGSAEAGSTIRIYRAPTAADCTAANLAATGSEADFAAAGLTVSVGDDTTTSFRATATDAGNTSPCSAPFTYTEDSTAPETTIDSGPSGETNDSTPSFSFSSSEPGSSFECRFDADAFGPCSGPGDAHTAPAALTEGAHSFEVRATDQAANTDQSPALRAFTVDSLAPDAPSIDASTPASPANDNEPELAGSAEAGSTIRIYRAPTAADCTAANLAATGSEADFAAAGLTVSVGDDTTTSFRATATDAGNTSPCSAPFTYTEDSTAPETTIDSGPSGETNDSTPSFSFSSSEPGSSFECRFDADAFGPCSGPGDAHTAPAALTEGAHSFEVRATDQAANTDQSPALRAFTVDSLAPDAPSIDASTPASPANDNEPELAGSAEAGSTIRIYRAPTAADCTAANLAATGSEADFAAAGLTVSVGDDTTTSFRATATDAGNTSPCSAPFTYTEDSTAPETTIDSGPSGETNDSTPSFSFSSSEPGSSFECRFDADAFGPCSGPGDAHTAPAALTEGAHSFEVRATDQAANTDQSPALRAFTVDSLAPDAPSIDASTPASPANDNEPELAGSAEAGSTIRIYRAPTAADCTAANLAATGSEADFAAAGLTVSVGDDTTTSFRATATDAGNTSPCSAPFTYTEDSTAPETTIDSGPSGETNDSTPSFSFSSSEPGSSFECRFDADAFGPCSGPGDAHTAPAALTEGAHSFEVRATDQAANTDQSPALRAFTVDSLAPDAPSIDASTPASPANDNEPELAGSAEAGSTIRIYRAPTAADCTAANLAATGSEADFAAAGLTVSVGDDTTTSFRATATDAGNTSPCSAPFTYTEDSTAPETTIDSGPSGETNDSTPSFSFSSSEPGSSFECRFDADAFGPCSGPGDAHTAPAALTEGAHSFEVRATDQAANTDQSPALRAFTVDSLAPDAPSIDASTPASPANDNEPELAGSAEAGSTIRIYRAPTAADCTAANLAATGSEADFAAAGLTVSVGDDTTTSFRATATDAGNTSPCSAPFTYTEDSTAPETTIDSGPSGETNDSTPSFSFSSSEPGSSFECRFDADAFGPCSGPGDAHTAPAALTEGAHSFEVRATDQAANTDQSPALRAFTVDSLAPDAPSIDASTPASPANDNEPELAGSAEAGSTIRIYRAPTAADCTAANLAATGSEADFAAAGLTVSVGDDTTTSFRATATDAGNTSPCSAPFTYTEDSTAPETTIDSGPSGETNDSTPSFSFSSSEPGSSFECRFDADAFGPCSGPGDAHTAPAALTEGAHSFEVRATDQAANTDQSPALRAFTVDSLAPDAPSIDASTPASPANDNEPELAGSAEAGSTIRIYRAPTAADCTAANLAATGSEADFAAAGLTVSVGDDTTTSFRATATDAGNTSPCSAPFTYTEDSTAPETTIDSGPSGETNDSTPSFSFSSSEPGSSFECRFDADAFGPCSGPGDAHTAPAALTEGAHSFEVRATDQAANTDQSPALRAFTVDSLAPDAPSIDASTPASPANDNEPELAGSAEAGSTIRIYRAPTAADCTAANLAATGSEADFAAAGLTVSVGDDTTTSFRATATDAGNTSPCSAPFTYTEDSTAPETTIDSGPSGETNDSTPSFSFSSSEPGSSFECRFDADAFGPCSGPGDAHTAPAALTEGAHSFEVRATDQAANTDQSPALRAFTVDSLAPDAPSIDASTPASPANDNEPELAGSAEAGSTIRIYRAPTAADCTAANLAATGSEADFAAAGLTVSVGDDTTTSFRATATDAGNTSPCSAPFTYTEDSTAPETTIDSGPSGETNDSTPSFSFSSSEPGSSFECRFDADAFGPCSGPGDAHTAPAALTEGAHSFEVRATDQAANTDQSPALRAFTVDSLAPDAPSIDASTPASPANDNEPELAGSAEAGSTIRIYRAPTAADCTAANLAATGSEADFAAAGLTVSVGDDTTTSFRATATDAGNTSPCSAPFTYTEDSTAPETTIDSGPSGETNDSTPSFSFSSSEPGSSFECRFDADAFGPCSGPGDAHTAPAALTEGAHSFEVRATDQAANTDQSPALRAFTVDSVPPASPTINDSDPNSPANDNNPELKGLAENNSTIRIYRAPTAAGCTPANLAATGTEAAFAGAGLTVNVANNTTTTFRATATDSGNTSACGAPFTYTEDSTAPETTITSGPSGTTSDNTPSFSFSSSEPGSSFQCRFDADAFGPCSGPGASHTASPALSQGPHSFEVRATDQAANTDASPATRAFTVDSVPPASPTINDSDPNSPANDNNPELKGLAENNSTIRIYRAPTAAGCTPANLAATGTEAAFAGAGLTVNVANNTTTTFRATATDSGNTSACGAPFTYTEDSTAPETTITSGPSGDTRDRTPTFRFRSSEPQGAEFQCRLDSASFKACSSPEKLGKLSYGSHTFRVRAWDAAGNVDPMPARRTFTVKR